jgi:tetratricopeptide (TPR) repeat protein
MPEHVFMERDRRRDHAFTRPDPTRARALGAPDACTACHRDRDRVWAAERVATWYGAGDDARRAARALAVLLEAGRRGAPAVAEPLRRVLASDLDSMRRASAARFLADMTEAPDVVEALRQAAADREPFVRAAAVRALGEVAARPEVRATLVAATRDARRLVRIEAAFALAGTSLEGLDRSARATIDQAFGEWLAAQAPTSDLPETHFNQGVFWARRGDVEQAEAAYRRAIALWPPDLAPRQNLAMLLVETGRPGDAAREFEDLLWRAPASPGAAHRLAEARLAAGDERAAARAFGNLTSRRAALRALVRLAHRWNDQAMAARWLPEALLADPATANDPDVRRALGLPAAAPAGAPAP